MNWRTFFAMLQRDGHVARRNLLPMLMQNLLQPLLLTFVFGRVLTTSGMMQMTYKNVLLPGIIAISMVLSGVQAVAMPLIAEFQFTKEIEDRLLAPIPTALVAVEKMIFAAMRALIAAVCMFPIGILILGSVPWRAAGAPEFVVVLILGALAGAAMGLTMGTLVPPNRISIAFSLVLTPLLFTGCSQYPWPTLDSLRWFQIVTLFNPLTYVSEGMRGALVPHVPHIRPWVCVVALVFWLAAFSAIGTWGFIRRAID